MITYDRATTKLIYFGDANFESEYGRWNGTFTNGLTIGRRIAQTRIPPGQAKTTRILVAGCGLGLLVEGLRDEAYTRTWGINLNDYFGGLWDTVASGTPYLMQVNTGAYMNTATNEWYYPPTGTSPPADWVPVGGFYKTQTATGAVYSPIAYGQAWPCEVRSDIRPLLGKFDLRTMTTTQVGQLTGLSGAQRSFDLIITEDLCTNYTVAELQATRANGGIYASCDALLAGGGQVIHLVSVGWDGTSYGGAPAMDLAQWTATLQGKANHQFQDIAGVQATTA